MHRRNFLRLAALVPASGALVSPLSRATPRSPHATKTLVLVELAGGNDGLNTVIPFTDPAYRRLRPNLAIERSQVVQLGGGLGLHPSLAPLADAWAHKELAVIAGVGYPKPNRSHFRSIEIWETGSDADETLDDGWLARSLPTHSSATLAIDGIVLGDRDLGPLHGGDTRGILMADPGAFARQARALGTHRRADVANNPALDHILKVQRDIAGAARSIERSLAAAPEPRGAFGSDRFAQQLKTVARLILAGAEIPVFKVTLGGFDTHANQLGKHRRRLDTLARGIQAFRAALRSSPRWRSTLVLTYSEFGRRAAENGSRGTDHGTAAPQLVIGGAVIGGHYGKQPSLTALQQGDLIHTVDFRSVYATVLQRHFGLPRPRAPRARPRLNFLG